MGEDSAAVAEEVVQGQGITFAQAAALLPAGRGGKPVNQSTIWRWSREGVKAADGSRVRLETARIGCRWVTSKAALMRFAARLSGAATGGVSGHAGAGCVYEG